MKKTLLTLSIVFGLALASFGQATLTQTTLSAKVDNQTTTIPLTSATGVVATSTVLFVDSELMYVNAINSTTAKVTRGYGGSVAKAHRSGSMVLLGPPNYFFVNTPSGACTSTNLAVLPAVNTQTGLQWDCSTVTSQWGPGFGNRTAFPQVSTAVASTAGKITPSGQLFHITGTAAITGFNIPVGFDPNAGQTICAIPDGAFTTTNANNIAIASTGVVGKTLCWTYDPNSAKFYPSY